MAGPQVPLVDGHTALELPDCSALGRASCPSMTPDEAAMAIRQTAARFAAEKASVLEMWAALHEHLHDLCVEQPLIGDFLVLFNALEEWEVSAGADRDRAIERSRQVARRLGASA